MQKLKYVIAAMLAAYALATVACTKPTSEDLARKRLEESLQKLVDQKAQLDEKIKNSESDRTNQAFYVEEREELLARISRIQEKLGVKAGGGHEAKH